MVLWPRHTWAGATKESREDSFTESKLPPTWQACTYKQDSYTNLVSDCSFDKTQVRTQEAGLQKGAETHTQAQLLSNTLTLPTETTYTGDWDTAEFGEQGFTKGSEEEKNLDGHPLQSQRPGPSLGESQITDGEVICSSNEMNSINSIAI